MDISSDYTLADCARFKAERDALAQRMEEIASEIDRTLSGVEGIEDAPALRWMRGLREALGSLHAPRISYEDIEAAKWVREYGGLDEVKRKVAESMDQADDYIALRCNLAKRAGDLYEMLDKEDDELIAMLDKRLMPEGMEWPRFDDGEPVRIGDEHECWCGNTHKVNSVTLREGRSVINESQPHSFVVSDGPFTAHGKRVKRPAPKVLDADGVEIRVGDDLYGCESGHGPFKVVETLEGSAEVKLKSYLDGSEFTTCAATFTHRAPVLAADGRPLREGETVWSTDSGTRYTVEKVTDELIPIKCCSEMGSTVSLHPSQLTHERLDSLERLADDLEEMRVAWLSQPLLKDAQNVAAEAMGEKTLGKALEKLVRRAKALAGDA